MEFIISDLLDDLQEVNVDILPYASASENRIKELTMEKIQGKFERKRRGRHPFSRILIVAAIVAALAVPVMAASGLLFTDWQQGILENNENKTDYNENLHLGAESKVWDTSGWAVKISAEEETATGLTFVCEELGNPEKAGSLTSTEGYWLEKWDGTTYVPMEGTYENSTVISIESAVTARWEINWENVYGTLASGSYRIGKHFTYTNPEGEAEELTYYAKFRIFTEDMDTYLKQYKAGMDALYEQDSFHLTWTKVPGRGNDYAYYTTEIWKSGSDYLCETRYINEDGSLWSRNGALYRDGKGYSLEWAGDTVLSGVAEWESVDWIDGSYFNRWYDWLVVSEQILGQVAVEGNTVQFYAYYDWRDETAMTPEDIANLNEEYPTWNHDYKEWAYTFDNEGKLSKIQYSCMLSLDPETADPHVEEILDVHTTSADEIAKVIEAQNVGGVRAFSWADDQAKYADIAITEGFVNTSKKAIGSAEEAIDRAKREADPKANPKYRELYEYNIYTAYFDEAAGMWKVQFSDSQDDVFVFLVYMDTDGITQMTVYPFGDPLILGMFDWEHHYGELAGDSITEGFENANPKEITRVQDAVDRAWEEYDPATHPMYGDALTVDTLLGVYYDADAQMWMVLLISAKNINASSQVYVDHLGNVQMIYHAAP